MNFKKGDKVRTDDGQAGEILFIDGDGVEAQVALARTSVKLRTETLEMFDLKPASRPKEKSKGLGKEKQGKKRGAPK